MKTKIKKIKEVFKKITEKVWQNLFLILIFLLGLDLILGGIFFWKYYFKKAGENIKTLPSLKINQALVEKILPKWKERDKNFEKALEKQYLDLFQGISIE